MGVKQTLAMINAMRGGSSGGSDGGSGGSSGGGAGVKTCTVRIVAEDDCVYKDDTYYAYIKHENGVTTLVEKRDAPSSNFDITLENVLCGSMIVFPWYGDNESHSFDGEEISAPVAGMSSMYVYYIGGANTDCTIHLYGESSDDVWGE